MQQRTQLEFCGAKQGDIHVKVSMGMHRSLAWAHACIFSYPLWHFTCSLLIQAQEAEKAYHPHDIMAVCQGVLPVITLCVD